MSLAPQPKQLELFKSNLPRKPYCSDDLASGLIIRAASSAVSHRYIQHNPPPVVAWLVFDIDRPASAFAWSDANLPPPAWVTVNPQNGHCHIVYGLISPVARTDAARDAPLRLLAAIEYAYKVALGADRGYTGLITKNPLHEHWRVLTLGSTVGLYDLHELAEYVDLPKRIPKRDLEAGIGRNVSLFDSLRLWAYVAARDYWRPDGGRHWSKACLHQAEAFNNLFPEPLPFSEVRSVARSVSKFVWKNFSPGSLKALIDRTHTPELQSARGRKSGEARRVGSTEEAKPWESAGVSRRTWYRKKANQIF